MANAVTFWKGTKAKYDALTEKPSTRIFFCEDTGEIFKGDSRFSRDISAVKFQGSEVSSGISSINFIGIGNVTSDDNGNITVRLGENLNCSNWGTTDGISTGSVKALKSSDIKTGTPSGSVYSATSSCTAKQVVYAVNTNSRIKAKTGTDTNINNDNSLGSATTETGASKNNGHEVHFPDQSCYFVVRVTEGTGDTAKAAEYFMGPITGDSTYKAKDGLASTATEKSSITCKISGFGEEPKKDSGASGYSGLVLISIDPNTLYSGKNIDFTITGIDLVSVADGKTTDVSTWTGLNAEYFHLAKTYTDASSNTIDISSVKGSMYSSETNPSGYTLTLGTTTKTIHGVTYYTSGTIAATCAAKNIGYPVSASTKATMTASGGSWFSTVTDTGTSKFTTWTDAKDAEMKYSNSASLNVGDWSDVGINMSGTNFIGTNTALNIPVKEKFLICNSSTYLVSSQTAGTYFAAPKDVTTLPAGEFMWFDGCLVYPSRDFSGYKGNTGYTVPDLTGERSYTKNVTLTGTPAGGEVTFTHKSVSGGLKSALTDETIQVYVKQKDGSWLDVSENGAGEASSVYGAESTTLKFGFPVPADTPTKDTGTAVKIVMTADVAAIKSVSFTAK